MIPVKLIIKGLYSYQDEQEQVIDFTRLTEGHLFGIFGGVGSGKSTILDAITFALYGSIDRLGQSGDNRYFNMMNLKSNNLLIDFEFINHAGKHFKVTVSGKRGKKFDEVKTFNRVIYEQLYGEWVPQEKLNAEEIVGLSYDNFRRTIIIPQGKFQEFLELSNTDRTRMLKDIFALEKFEFDNKVKSLTSQNNNEKAGLEGELKQFEGLEKEKLEALEAEISTLQKEFLELKSKVLEKETEHKTLLDLKKVLDELQNTKTKLQELLEQEESVNQLQIQLENYRKALEVFKSIFDRKREKTHEIAQKHQRVDHLSNSLKSFETQLEEARSRQKTLQPEFEKLNYYKELTNDYKIAADLVALHLECAGIKDNLTKGKAFLAEHEQLKTKNKEQFDTLKQQIAETKNNTPDWPFLNKVQAWFTQKDVFSKELNSIKTDLDQQRNAHNHFKTTLAGTISEPLKPHLLNGHNDHQHISERLKVLIEDHLKNEKELQLMQQELMIKSKLGEYAQSLNQGKPCPLCGSMEHPSILNSEDLSSHLQTLNQQADDLRTLQQATQSTQTALIKWESNFESNEEQLKKLNGKFIEAEKKLADWLNSFSFKGFNTDDEQKIRDLMASAELIEKRLKELEVQKENLELEQAKIDNTLEKGKERINTRQNELSAAQARITEKETQLKHLSTDQVIQKRESFNQLAIQTEQKWVQVEAEMEKLQLALQQLEQQKSSVCGQLSALKEEVSVSEKQLHLIKTELDAKLETSTFSSVNEVEAVLNSSLDINNLQEVIKKFNDQLISLSGNIERLEKQREGKTFGPDHCEQLSRELAEIKLVQQEMNDQLVRLQTRHQQHIQDLKKKEELLQKLSKLQQRAENLSTLSWLFRASGFVNYVSSIYMQQLCKVANERFYKLTRQQLHLEVDEQNNFHVRDMLNDGRTRLVKTLSGGQKFQASLCLALALAESVQQFNRSEQSFFFLDEGFGSLDKDALQVVFEALKSLRKENRIVGLISHVEDLQQEIDIHIKVINDPAKGSIISNSWN